MGTLHHQPVSTIVIGATYGLHPTAQLHTAPGGLDRGGTVPRGARVEPMALGSETQEVTLGVAE